MIDFFIDSDNCFAFALRSDLQFLRTNQHNTNTTDTTLGFRFRFSTRFRSKESTLPSPPPLTPLLGAEAKVTSTHRSIASLPCSPMPTCADMCLPVTAYAWSLLFKSYNIANFSIHYLFKFQWIHLDISY